MTAWSRAERAGVSLRSLWRRPAVRTGVRYAGYFAMGFAASAGKLFSGCGPFGIAAMAASGTELSGLFCLAGAVGGYTLAGGVFGALRYIATVFMVFTVGFVTRGTNLCKRRWFLPAAAAVLTGITGVLYANVSFGGVPGLTRIFLEVVLSGGCAYVFSFLLSPEGVSGEAAETLKSISILVLSACMLIGLAQVRLWGTLSVGRFLTMLGVMAAGFCGGPMTGSAAGAALGLGMDMAEGAGLFFSAAYALSGLLAGALYRCGRLTFSVSFCAGMAVTVLLGWKDGVHIPALYECFAASVIFMLLPQAALTPVGSLLRVGSGHGETAFRLYHADRLDRLAEGFRGLYEAASEAEAERPEQEEMTAVFDRAADAVCRTCGCKDTCWKKDYADTVAALASMTEGMSRRGTVSVSDLPVAFRQRCVAPGGFVSAVNGELRGLMYRRQYAARLREGRAAA